MVQVVKLVFAKTFCLVLYLSPYSRAALVEFAEDPVPEKPEGYAECSVLREPVVVEVVAEARDSMDGGRCSPGCVDRGRGGGLVRSRF